jgi:hypothetical protein
MVLLRFGQVLAAPLQFQHVDEAAGPIRRRRREQQEVRPARLQPHRLRFAPVRWSRFSPS